MSQNSPGIGMSHPHVVVERSQPGYLRVLLARPDQRNALNGDMVHAIVDALNDDVTAPVLLGSTDPRVFCAGADLSISAADRATVSDLLYQCYEVMIARPGPVIAVITGPAVGGGAQLAAAADLRVAGPRARLRWIGPPKLDLAVGAWILPSLVGRGTAMELTLTGRWVEAAEAHACGLVNWLDDAPDRLADQMAESLATRGAGTVEHIKMIASADGLLDRLHAERAANRAAWERVLSRGGGCRSAEER
jgi:enoyl-CoA hydratase/carnithine racemase